MAAMIAANDTAVELALPTLDVRALARRAVVPAALALVAVGALLLAQSRVHTVSDAIKRGFDISPSWAAVAIVSECASIAGYVGLLSNPPVGATRTSAGRRPETLPVARSADRTDVPP
jgi:hypothetical protein